MCDTVALAPARGSRAAAPVSARTEHTRLWQVKGTKPGVDSQMKTYYRDK